MAILVNRKVQKRKFLNLEILPQEIQDVIGDDISTGHIAVMYVDEVKGIEFDKVYALPRKMTKNEKYIAYTRALSELIIVVEDSI